MIVDGRLPRGAVREQGRRVKDAALASGISVRTAHEWLARGSGVWRACPHYRSSAPARARAPHRLPADVCGRDQRPAPPASHWAAARASHPRAPQQRATRASCSRSTHLRSHWPPPQRRGSPPRRHRRDHEARLRRPPARRAQDQRRRLVDGRSPGSAATGVAAQHVPTDNG
jgi:hypothetical protein